MKTAIAIVLLLGIIVTANYYYYVTNKDTIKIDSNACDLQKKPCMVDLPNNASITFDMNPKPIPLLNKIDFNAKLKGIEANELRVDIVATNMNMGNLSYKLNNLNNGEFTGNGSLGVCLVRKMQWMAKVNIKTKKENYLVNFPFTTIKN